MTYRFAIGAPKSKKAMALISVPDGHHSTKAGLVVKIIYKLKKPWDDGTTEVKFTPMVLMEKLAALVPRPRVHLTRFHGVLAPHYKFRKQIVPKKPEISQPLELVQPDQIPKPAPKRMS